MTPPDNSLWRAYNPHGHWHFYRNGPKPYDLMFTADRCDQKLQAYARQYALEGPHSITPTVIEPDDSND